VQRGDRRAFELLYASYEGGLFRVAHRLTGSSEQAAALVEATFTRALATLPEDGLDSVDIGAHLYGTARSLSYERSGTRNGIGHANGNGHVHGNVHVNGSGAAHANGTGWDRRGEHASEVAAATARLAPRQRLTLALRDLERRPDDEIALALGTDRPSVPALVARARLRLREELALATPTMGCASHLADLSAYADGTLPAERRAALEAHLEECGDCRAVLFALREAALR
jgi:DNA-directed RNA polymerase specialized sigma24 family protein